MSPPRIAAGAEPPPHAASQARSYVDAGLRPSPAGGWGWRPRLNPVAARLAVDAGMLGLACAGWCCACPDAPWALGLAACGLALLLLAACGSYRSRLPPLPRGFSPALWLGIAPAVAAPTQAGSAGVLMPAMWLGLILFLAVVAGRLLLAAALAGPVGRLSAPRTVLFGPLPDTLPDAWAASLGPGLLGYLSPAPQPAPRDHAGAAWRWLGPAAALADLVRADRIERIVLTDPLDPAVVDRAVPALARLDIEVCVLAMLPGGARLLPLARASLSDGARLLKRAEDVLGAALLLALLALPMALIALLIMHDSRGSPLFVQLRAGRNGRPFRMLKFRTMRQDAADPDGARQTSRDDPRLTRIGRVLRRTSLDELPQLFNVLRGDMSLIGPRPHALGTRAAGQTFEQVHRAYAARHRLRPGLTGLAQVRGQRGALETAAHLRDRTDSDLDYVAGWSLRRDLLILARTPWTVLRMRNAY